MAGPWLRYRGHLQNISRNMLLGALNAFTGTTGTVTDALTGQDVEVWQAAADYRDAGTGSIIVAEDNYGEGLTSPAARPVIVAISFETSLPPGSHRAVFFVTPFESAEA